MTANVISPDGLDISSDVDQYIQEIMLHVESVVDITLQEIALLNKRHDVWVKESEVVDLILDVRQIIEGYIHNGSRTN